MYVHMKRLLFKSVCIRKDEKKTDIKIHTLIIGGVEYLFFIYGITFNMHSK